MTLTPAQTIVFNLPANGQHRLQIDNTDTTNTTNRSHNANVTAPAESDTSSATLVSANQWMAPKKKSRIAFCLVVAFHLALAWSLQSSFMRQLRQMEPVKEVLMTYIAPANVEQAPAKKPMVKTLAMTTPVVSTPTLMPVAATVEPAIETANKSLQMAVPQTIEVVAPTTPSIAPKTIISGVEYLLAPQPVYPLLAKRAGEQGKAMLRVLVSDKGLPESIDLQKSPGSARLDEAAKQAVSRARFKPYLEDGKALAVYVIVPINFQLDQAT